MNKRDFIKTTVLASAGLFTAKSAGAGSKSKKSTQKELKHWCWEGPNKEETEKELEKKYKSYFEAGIRGIFFGGDSEKHYLAAKEAGLESHRWMWTLNRGEKSLLDSHPEWYAISRTGKSCADDPPYVSYYRWLCPSRPEVADYLEKQVTDIIEKDYVDGIHLDYVRYSDVILPVNLWDKYGITQNKELPEYDFCYCDTCRSGFKKLHGLDPLEIKHPDQSLSWRYYRYNQVTRIVNRLAGLAHKKYNKPITAAVFPTPELARRIVRQDWTRWNLDAVCPMVYHGFYKEEVSWIGDAVAEGIHFLCDRFPLYAGIYLPDFKSDKELEEGIKAAINNGASGVSFFGGLNENTLNTIKKTNKRLNF